MAVTDYLNTSDTLQYWKNVYGASYLKNDIQSSKPMVQALSIQPRVRYQKITVEKDLGQFFNVQVSGPEVQDIKPDMIFDSIARADFTLKDKIAEKFSKLEHYEVWENGRDERFDKSIQDSYEVDNHYFNTAIPYFK